MSYEIRIECDGKDCGVQDWRGTGDRCVELTPLEFRKSIRDTDGAGSEWSGTDGDDGEDFCPSCTAKRAKVTT